MINKEPIIYKPSVYNGNGIYNTGAGGVYNGRGVYNDGAGGEVVEIGGKEYRVIKLPDGKKWIGENLDFIWAGLQINNYWQTTNPNAWYYQNNENENGWNGKKCGLLYNWYAVKYLNDNISNLINGWHVPTESEWQNLKNAIVEDAGKKLKCKDLIYNENWPSGWRGVDEYGFKMLPAGENVNGSFDKFGTWARFWGADNTYTIIYAYKDWDDLYFASGINRYYGYSVRLVKD